MQKEKGHGRISKIDKINERMYNKRGKWCTADDWNEEQKKQFNDQVEKHSTLTGLQWLSVLR
jgi:hypothetical protein